MSAQNIQNIMEKLHVLDYNGGMEPRSPIMVANPENWNKAFGRKKPKPEFIFPTSNPEFVSVQVFQKWDRLPNGQWLHLDNNSGFSNRTAFLRLQLPKGMKYGNKSFLKALESGELVEKMQYSINTQYNDNGYYIVVVTSYRPIIDEGYGRYLDTLQIKEKLERINSLAINQLARDRAGAVITDPSGNPLFRGTSIRKFKDKPKDLRSLHADNPWAPPAVYEYLKQQ